MALQLTVFGIELPKMVVVLFMRELVKEEGSGFGILLAKNAVRGIWGMWVLAVDNSGSWVAEGLEGERAWKVKMVFLA